MGRPPKWKDINKEQLGKCAEKLWSYGEIGSFFNVSSWTIERHFAKFIDECRQRGKAKLRDLQWKRALEGSDKIIIHMSKHMLGEEERVHTEHSGTMTNIQQGTVLILPEKEIHADDKTANRTADRLPKIVS